jgi:asparagine synthase (glutamine-hydrolysing)
MCGITGICGLRKPVHPEPHELLPMIHALRHRGPDEAGYYLDDWAALGHGRLSIIDLSTGSQPISNEDQSLWIIYNGEVFNYPELREDLLKKGHHFTTHSDTEVLLHQIEQYGPDGLAGLNGQYAFAVWNSRTRELLLARDRVGILPLFYTIQNDRLLFASEIKSLFACPDIPRRLDPLALEQIFTLWTTLPGRTAFKNIYELPPGHYLHLKNGTVDIRPYWSLPFVPPSEYSRRPIDELTEQMKALLTDSIRIRLRADVPVGCYLSGGLDSSGITSTVVKNFNNQVRTFGIRFEEAAFDEGEYQTRMVDYLKVNHTELIADNQTIGQNFPTILWHTEKPILRTAPIPLFLLSQVVRDHDFKVVLTGEGADEFFGGYNIFRETKIRAFLSRQPDSLRRREMLSNLYSYIFKDPRLKKTMPGFFARGTQQTDDPFFSHQIRWQNTARIKIFFSEALRRSIGDYNPIDDLRARLPRDFSALDPLSRAQYLEASLFLSNYLLSSQGDRMAMGHSVELRVPYLDHRVIEFMAAVPPRWKILGLKEKYLLKRVFRDILPEPVVSRPKHPYRAPIQQSLWQGKNFYQELADHPQLISGELFDPQKVRNLIRKIENTSMFSETDGMALAGIFSTLIIQNQFIEQFPTMPQQGPPFTVRIDKRTLKKV